VIGLGRGVPGARGLRRVPRLLRDWRPQIGGHVERGFPHVSPRIAALAAGHCRQWESETSDALAS